MHGYFITNDIIYSCLSWRDYLLRINDQKWRSVVTDYEHLWFIKSTALKFLIATGNIDNTLASVTSIYMYFPNLITINNSSTKPFILKYL